VTLTNGGGAMIPWLRAVRDPGTRPLGDAPAVAARRIEAVLFDRDGTLVEDVPYNADPRLVRPVPGARDALDRLRAAGLKLGVITNQSSIGRGLASADQVEAVNRRVEELLGPFDTWQVCPHDAYDGCACRKPAPGMVLDAAAALGVATPECVVVGDIGADMAAAAAAGASGVLVPTPMTRIGEVAAAVVVAADLAGAVDWILGPSQAGAGSGAVPASAAGSVVHAALAPAGRRMLAVRADSAGDVLLCGPAVRALADRAARVTMLCGPRGKQAADLLPGVDDIVTWAAPWIDAGAPPVDPGQIARLRSAVEERGIEEAVIFTSFHQSALPLALLLRLAGVGRISAISEDWPGSLLDVRHHVPPGVPEAERALSLARAAGYRLPDGDDGRLRITVGARERDPRRVVVHPGASVPARAAPVDVYARVVKTLHGEGFDVTVTGGPGERDLTAQVAASYATDLGGRTSLRELGELIAAAGAVVVGNTGPAHLAAATGTPVVSLFAPTVPFAQWGPYRVAHVRLGAAMAPCADTRVTHCPVPGHPCLGRIDELEVLAAVRTLTGIRP
jgi:HAD superfamily hydrolase (TIGR01662 family)